MMVYKQVVNMNMNQIHQYLFCHKSTPKLGGTHRDYHHSIFALPIPELCVSGKINEIIGDQEWLNGDMNCLLNIAANRRLSLSMGAKKR
jgi:hypothetical protein